MIVFSEKNGIIHEVSVPRILQQNGIAERKNRTLEEMINAMLLSSGFPDNMWEEVVYLLAIFLIEYPIRSYTNPCMSYGKAMFLTGVS